MSSANHKRIEIAASPPCAEFRPRFNAKSVSPSQPESRGGDRGGTLTSIVVFISTAVLVAFATNLSMHLVNLRMQSLGISEFYIGVSVATQALGIVLVAPFAKYFISALGIRRTFILGALISSSTLIAFNFAALPFTLAVLRLIFATGLALLFVVSESLVITRTSADNRGKVIGWYATGLAVGTTAGPAFITLTGVGGTEPLLWSAAFFWLATTPILAYVKRGQELAPVIRNSSFAAIKLVPIAFVTAFVFGIVDNGGLSMLSVYSTLNGYDVGNAAILASAAMMGGIALQIPLGVAANRSQPRTVLLLCGVGSILLLAVLPKAMHTQTEAMSVSFLLGGLLEGFYTVGLICIARQCRTIGISSANGCFISFCGFGEFVGPLTTGTGIQFLGSEGFVVVLTALLACYIVMIVSLAETREPAPARATAAVAA
jgi:MFS family permease